MTQTVSAGLQADIERRKEEFAVIKSDGKVIATFGPPDLMARIQHEILMDLIGPGYQADALKGK